VPLFIDALPLFVDVPELLFIDPLPLFVDAPLFMLDEVPVFPVFALAGAFSLTQSVSAVPWRPEHAAGIVALVCGVEGALAVPVVWAPSEPAAASAVATSRSRGLNIRFSCFIATSCDREEFRLMNGRKSMGRAESLRNRRALG